jgi:aryl-alcohol dehydrogenase-like predicted oxidoreductase
MEDEVLPTLHELGIGFVAYSPLGRGLLTGTITGADSIAADDVRRARFPRFAEENLDSNVALAQRVATLASARGVTPAQLALAWLLHRGDDVVPIPGTKRAARVEENAGAADVELSDEEIAQLDTTVPRDAVRGQRHWDMAAVNR